jgi:hypothetical protein
MQVLDENDQPWWKRRSKHGRGLIFSSPQLMWEAACEYFAHEDNRTDLTKTEVGWFQGSMSKDEVVCKVPYTWQGLTLFFGCALTYFRNRRLELRKRVKEGTNDEVDDDFLAVMDLIEQTIFKQQFDNAQSGKFKEGLTARYLRIQDSSELSTPNDKNNPEQEQQQFKITLKLD